MKLTPSVIALLISLIADRALALEAARHDCAQALSAYASTVETKIGFVNHSQWAVRLYRHTSSVARTLVKELAPSEGVGLKSNLGDVWEVAYADRDSCAYKYTAYSVPSTVSFAGVWNQNLPCSAEQASPQVAGPETTITFRNSRAEPVKIYWVNREGRRQQFGQTLPPGGRLDNLRTFTDHVWVATTEADACVTVFRAYDKLWGDIR